MRDDDPFDGPHNPTVYGSRAEMNYYEQVPDAPWIRDAENNGMPADDPPECPVCGKCCETIYMDRSSDEVLGCDRCLASVDAWDWMEQVKENERNEERW